QSDVGRHRHLGATPEGVPVECRDSRTGEAGDAVADRAHAPRHRARLAFGTQRAELLEIAARHECPVACAGDDKSCRALRAVESLVELVHRLQRDGVAGLRAVDGDDRQTLIHLEVDHRAFSVCGIGILSSGEEHHDRTEVPRRAMRKIPVELTERYEDEGWWRPETLGDLIADGLAANPATGFWVHSAVRPYEGTFADVESAARRLAAGLRARGVGPGDAVAIQLPNWVEAAVAFWASAFLGAVVVPIVHFYGRRELSHIIPAARPKVFITAEEFGRMKYQRDLCADVPIVGLVGAEAQAREEHEHRFDDLLADEPLGGTIAAAPAGPALIAFTSGTTSKPKGVIHSHQTLSFETRQLLANYTPDRGRQLTATPVGHFIGMLGAFLIPVLEGASIDLCDVWDPGKVLELIESDGLSIG